MADAGLDALNLTLREQALIDSLGIRTIDELAGMIAASPDAATDALGEELVQRVKALRPVISPGTNSSRFFLGARIPKKPVANDE